MAVPLAVSGVGGPYDIILTVGEDSMGFLTTGPAKVRQVSTFAPPIRIGGDPAYANDTYQQHVMDGFDAGGDRDVYESGDKRYQWSNGQVALQVEKRVTLSSMWESSDAAKAATARDILDFNPATAPQPWIVAAVGTTLRAFNTTTEAWADAHPAAGVFGASIPQIFANDQYLFIALGASVDAQSWTGASLTTTFAALTGIKATVFGWYGQTLYRALAGSIYAATNNDGTTWGSAIPVGYTGTNITDIYESNGYLFIAKPEGLFLYDGSTVSRLVDATKSYTTNNFKGMCDWEGAIYLPWINAIRKGAISTSARLTSSDITPRMKGDTAKERYGHGKPIKIVSGPTKIYVALDDGEGVYPELLSYNGMGYQQIYRGTSGDTMNALGYSRQMDWVVINDGATRIKRVINCGDVEYPNYNTTGEFWTPSIDGGYPGENKAFRSIEIETSGCLVTKEYITISYRLDGGAWVEAGTVSANGKTEVILNATDGHVVGKKIEFKFVLTRTTGVTSTPVMKMPIVLRMLVIPEAIDAYQEVIKLKISEPLNNGYGKLSKAGYTIREMLEFLATARSSTLPISKIDEFGRFYMVKITDKSENYERIPNKSHEMSVNVSLNSIDLAPGLSNTWSLTLTSTKADTGTITPELTLAAGAPTPEWLFTNPDGTTATYSTASVTHTVSGTGVTTIELGPASLFAYITGFDMNGDNLTSTITPSMILRFTALEDLNLSTNASLICAFKFTDLPYTKLKILDLHGTASTITDSLGNLPSVMEELYLDSTSCSITGAASAFPVGLKVLSLGTVGILSGTTLQLPRTLTYLQNNNASTVISGTWANLPTGMTYIHIAQTASTITGATSTLPATLETLYIYTTSCVLTGGIGSFPAGIKYLNMAATTGSNITGTIAQIPASMISCTVGGALTNISGSWADIPASVTVLVLQSTQSSASGTMADLPSTLITLQIGTSNCVLTGGATPMVALAIEILFVENLGMSQAEVDAILLRGYTDRMLFTGTPYLSIGGTNAAPSGTYADEDPPTTGNGMRYELVKDPEAEGFNKWTVLV